MKKILKLSAVVLVDFDSANIAPERMAIHLEKCLVMASRELLSDAARAYDKLPDAMILRMAHSVKEASPQVQALIEKADQAAADMLSGMTEV